MTEPGSVVLSFGLSNVDLDDFRAIEVTNVLNGEVDLNTLGSLGDLEVVIVEMGVGETKAKFVLRLDVHQVVVSVAEVLVFRVGHIKIVTRVLSLGEVLLVVLVRHGEGQLTSGVGFTEEDVDQSISNFLSRHNRVQDGIENIIETNN